jgi:hypothetical protein
VKIFGSFALNPAYMLMDQAVMCTAKGNEVSGGMVASTAPKFNVMNLQVRAHGTPNQM